jgi:hypothetical protein
MQFYFTAWVDFINIFARIFANGKQHLANGKERLAKSKQFLANFDQILASTLLANFLPYTVHRQLFTWQKQFDEIDP